MAAFCRCSSFLWMRRKKAAKSNFRFIFRSFAFGPACESITAGIEHRRQLAVQHNIHGGDTPLTIAASISQSGSTLGSVVHVDGSSCFEQQTAIRLTGTLADGNISLTSVSVNEQVITLAGTITKKDGFPYQLTGTYSIVGGCASGNQGNVTGYSVGAFNGSWYGNLTTAGGADIHWGTNQLGRVGASSEGSFGLTGTFNFDGACFNSGKLTYPTPSYILGTSVALNIPTDNGTVAFVGTAGPDEGGLIEGTYTVIGASCESAGPGYLSPWEY